MSLRVAILGYGYAGRTFHAPLIAATPGLELAAVTARSAQTAAAAEAAGLAVRGVEAVLADPAIELVVVATPSGEHVELTRAALAAGKHVVVEKPIAATVAEAQSLADEALARGRVLSVFHNRRWDADFLTLKALLTRGEVGEPVELASTWDRYRPAVRDRWRERPGPAAGLWFDLGAHLVDQALLLFGPPRQIWADIGTQRAGGGAADYFHVRLRYASALRVTLQSRSLAVSPAPRFVLHGTGGSYVKRGLDTQEAMLQAARAPGGEGWGVDPEPGLLQHPDAAPAALANLPGDYRRFYAGMRDAIREGAPAPVTAGQAVAVVRLLELAEASAATGRTVPV